MGPLSLKILSIALIITGESLMIYAEVSGAKVYSGNMTFRSTFWHGFIFILSGAMALLVGYMMGYRGFKNIWIVSAISITTILITEPVINYVIFHEIPTRGALVGLILGALGFISALFL